MTSIPGRKPAQPLELPQCRKGQGLKDQLLSVNRKSKAIVTILVSSPLLLLVGCKALGF